MKTSVWILVLFTLFACSNHKNSNKTQTLEIIEAEKPLIKLPKNIILMIGDGMGISQITAETNYQLELAFQDAMGNLADVPNSNWTSSNEALLQVDEELCLLAVSS